MFFLLKVKNFFELNIKSPDVKYKKCIIGIGLPITEEHSHAARHPANDNPFSLLTGKPKRVELLMS
jgi:hypothetical protein